MNPRRRAALEAMAAQSTSPHERDIARHKLRTARMEEEHDESWRKAWADQQEHERLAERAAAGAMDREITEIVRRWRNGTFTGIRVSIGASGHRARFDK